MSNIIHKVKDALTGNKDQDHHDTTTGTTTASSSNPNYYGTDSTHAGPHTSHAPNKLDPRVDSDRDGSRTVGTGNTYGSNTGSGMTGMTGPTGTGAFGTGTHSSGGHGPHNSGIANRADPFVDSTTGTSNTRTGGMGTGTGYTGSTTSGPHNSNIANKVDPRVDSDRDGSYTVGGNTTSSGYTGTGMTGTTGHSGYSGMSGTGTTGTGTHSKTTAGPHSSDMANKLDPRVDSDLDGSRTVGSGGRNY